MKNRKQITKTDTLKWISSIIKLFLYIYITKIFMEHDFDFSLNFSNFKSIF